jgi:hypothetical protein
VLSFSSNTKMAAATSELGGNLFGATEIANEQPVWVPLGEDEWAPD